MIVSAPTSQRMRPKPTLASLRIPLARLNAVRGRRSTVWRPCKRLSHVETLLGWTFRLTL